MTNHTKNSSLAILLIGFVLLYKLSYQLCLIIIILSIFFVGLFRGVFSLKANYFMPSISKSPLNKCILTFDDGPNEYSLEVLQVLKRHQISALFFVIGKQLELHPEIKEQIVREGHLLGNHTYSHAHNFAFMSSKMVMLEQYPLYRFHDESPKIYICCNNPRRPATHLLAVLSIKLARSIVSLPRCETYANLRLSQPMHKNVL